jgi:putative DNA primase/helicase
MTPTEMRLRLLAAGYLPLPLYGKEPPVYGKNNARKGLAEWTELTTVTPEQIKMWERIWPDAVNTGMLTKLTPTFDADIMHLEAAEAVEDLVRERYEERGHTLIRIGKAPKRAIPFRTQEPFKKIIANLTAPDGSEHKIEFLCDGQQVVVDGIHPDTGKPYSWHGGVPGDIAHDELPYITGAEAQQLVDDVVKLLVDRFGFAIARWDCGNGAGNRANPHAAGCNPQADPAIIATALTFIPNTVGWDEWNTIGMATWRATGGSEAGFAAFNTWSKKSDKYDPQYTSNKWIGYFKSPPTSIGAGTILYLANQHCPGWRERTARGPEPPPADPPEAAPPQPEHAEADTTLTSVRASSVTPTVLQWLWPNRFALGKLGILAGLPDEGKGQIFADIAARVTRGADWPCGEGRAPKGNVVLLTAEDDISDTVVPRLIAAGADLACVEIVRMVRTGNKTRMFNLMTDLPLLRQKIIAVGNVNLVEIDPVSAYQGIGKVDSFRTNDVRALLGPLVELAGELMIAVLGIMHFNKKTDVTNALLRISDSLAYGATARGVYCVVDDAENNRKLLVKGKNNIAPKNQPALAYGFGVQDVGRDPKTNTTILAPHILWHPDPVDVTATEAMNAASKSPAARDGAKKFLADILASGPVKKTEIEEAAEANCIATRTLWRAKDELGIVAKKGNSGFHDGWTWQLPLSAKRWEHGS